MTASEFIAKWKGGGKERQNAQEFFIDLCRLFRHPTPREADAEGTSFAFEYGADKTGGRKGWADAWKRGFFGWEAKGTHKDLNEAYKQLKMYADSLLNPPLLVVSDLQSIIVHTNFTNSVKTEHRVEVTDLENPDKRRVLEAMFHDPERLRPGITRAVVTQRAADKFTELATALRTRGHAPGPVAHFLNRLLFCMFAEDIGLLPGHLFTKLVQSSQGKPDLFTKFSGDLFAAMNKGGHLAFESIEWFNGGLFEDDATLRLEADDLKLLLEACLLDWSEIEPSIFGTLFERGLDPSKRSQLGAHYTDPETIMKIVRPVVVEPWLAEWEAEKVELAKQIGKASKTVSKAAQTRFNRFLERFRAFTVLDPACGSGNFLYLSLRALKDTEKQILLDAEALGLGLQFPAIGPQSVKGIELNGYAAELARVTIWIGEIQWMIANGYGVAKNPILKPLEQIENRDALLNSDGTEAVWPTADVIVGNPPFVGDKKMIGELGHEAVATLRKTYEGRVPGGADLVCYWFEKANDLIRMGNLKRAGLVTTNSIRGGRNQEVLKHICEVSRIFNAWSDEKWVNEGAALRVSLICFGKSDAPSRLDGDASGPIYPDLTSAGHGSRADLTQARPLAECGSTAFSGITKKGAFDISGAEARRLLKDGGNPNGRPNSDVLFPWKNGEAIVNRDPDKWIVHFGERTEAEASLYAAPFALIESRVKPVRMNTSAKGERENWWKLARRAPGMFSAIQGLKRFIVTPETPTHTVFSWMSSGNVPDKNLVVISRDDDTTFGILQSSLHIAWVRALGSPYGNHPTARRYNCSRVFDTFPFPEGLTPNVAASAYATDSRSLKIAEAVSKLLEARDRWLNPPEWTDCVAEVVPGLPYRVVAKGDREADLRMRTLTNLYNAPPSWLTQRHRALDEAVATAYGWRWPLDTDEVLRRLFVLNQERSGATQAPAKP